MEEVQFLRIVQSRVARVAVGASTVRGRGNAGTVGAARAFLRSIDLTAFSTSDPETLASALERITQSLRQALPETAAHWGIARKVLNIFIRDCLYNKYLTEAFDIAEPLLEVPLDSYTATALGEIEPVGTLPRWPGMRHLTPDISTAFQTVAAQEAERRGIARVHLDGLWWSLERDELKGV